MPKTYDPLLMLVALVAVVSIGIMLFPSMDTTDLVGNAFEKLKDRAGTRLTVDTVEGYFAILKSGDTSFIAVVNPDIVHESSKLNGRLTYSLRTARREIIEPTYVREERSLSDLSTVLAFYDKYGTTMDIRTEEEEMELIINSILYGMQDDKMTFSTLTTAEKELYIPPEEYIRQEEKDYSILTYDPNLHEWYFPDAETEMDWYDSTNEPEITIVLAVDGEGNVYKIVNDALLEALRETVINLGKPGTAGELVPPEEEEQRTLPEDDPIEEIHVDLEDVEIGEEEEDEPIEQVPVEVDPVEISEGEESEEDEPVEIEVDEEIPVECSEDDGGDEPSVKGYHTGTYPWGGETYMIPDSCRISTTNEKVTSCTAEDCKLMEYYCVEDSADSKYGYLFWKFYEGEDCNNGATI